jgi:hypothetical protein
MPVSLATSFFNHSFHYVFVHSLDHLYVYSVLPLCQAMYLKVEIPSSCPGKGRALTLVSWGIWTLVDEDSRTLY